MPHINVIVNPVKAVSATLELRRWSRNQQAATGRPVEAETLRDRASRVYRLKGGDLDYAVEFGASGSVSITDPP